MRHLFFWVVFVTAYTKPVSVNCQENIDSLMVLVADKSVHDTIKLSLYRDIAYGHKDPVLKIAYADSLLDLAAKVRNDVWLYSGYFLKGTAFRMISDLDSALSYYIQAANRAENSGYKVGIGQSYLALGDVYSQIESYGNSILYYQKAIAVLRTSRDSVSLGSVLLNLGYSYYFIQNYDSALRYYSESGEIFKRLKFDYGSAYCLGNTGLVYAKLGDFGRAEDTINKALVTLEAFEDEYAICDYSIRLSEIYLEQKAYNKAAEKALKGYNSAQSGGFKEQIRDACQVLARSYQELGQYRHAYEYQSLYIAYRDSINNAETIQKMADLRTAFEVGQKQVEVDILTIEKENQQRLMIALAMIILLTLFVVYIVFRNYKEKNKINKLLEQQKAALEQLNQTKDRFFSIISHDLRGPVSAFHGISRMIKFLVTTKNTDQLIELAEDIDTSVDRLTALLDNLLNWAMQQQGHFPYVPEKIEMKDLVDDLQATFSNMATGKNIHLVSTVDADIWLWADKNMTETILRNLVNNALKFTPEGGEVSVTVDQGNGMAKIFVKDTGVGIPQEKLDSLFKFGDRKSTYGTSGERGLGLGLQLVYEFVEVNGGSIEVTSKEHEGAPASK